MNNGLIAKASIEIEAPSSEVWKALIDPAMIREYLFGTEAISEWSVGSTITFKGTWDGKEYEDRGNILEMKPEKRLTYTYWSSLSGLPDIPENYATIDVELERAQAGTRLTLTQDNNDTEKSRNHSENNWKQVLETMKRLLEKR
jgi:uncharacterized protein YndB with AHSA1/START domain